MTELEIERLLQSAAGAERYFPRAVGATGWRDPPLGATAPPPFTTTGLFAAGQRAAPPGAPQQPEPPSPQSLSESMRLPACRRNLGAQPHARPPSPQWVDPPPQTSPTPPRVDTSPPMAIRNPASHAAPAAEDDPHMMGSLPRPRQCSSGPHTPVSSSHPSSSFTDLSNLSISRGAVPASEARGGLGCAECAPPGADFAPPPLRARGKTPSRGPSPPPEALAPIAEADERGGDRRLPDCFRLPDDPCHDYTSWPIEPRDSGLADGLVFEMEV
jgi:hypothetical protein